MSNRLLKLLPILLAFVLICSVSAFAVFAEGEEESSTVEETTSAPADESQGDESGDAASEGDESEDAASEGESEEESDEKTEDTASDDKSKEESKGNTTGATSTATSTDPHAGHNHDEESAGLDPLTWQLIITAAVIVILVAVLFILAKTNTKIGQKIANFFKNYKSEIKKVVWMPKNDLIKSTGIVLLVLVVACALIGLLDWAFSSALNLLSSIG